jgi:hypothetical protein
MLDSERKYVKLEELCLIILFYFFILWKDVWVKLKKVNRFRRVM